MKTMFYLLESQVELINLLWNIFFIHGTKLPHDLSTACIQLEAVEKAGIHIRSNNWKLKKKLFKEEKERSVHVEKKRNFGKSGCRARFGLCTFFDLNLNRIRLKCKWAREWESYFGMNQNWKWDCCLQSLRKMIYTLTSA